MLIEHPKRFGEDKVAHNIETEPCKDFSCIQRCSRNSQRLYIPIQLFHMDQSPVRILF